MGHPPTTRPLTPSLRPAVGTAPASRSAEVRSGQKPLPVGGPLQSRLSGSASPDFSIGLPGGLGWRACRTPTYTMSAAATRTTMTVPHIGTSDNLGAFSSPSPVIPRVAGVVTLTPGRSTLPGSRGNRICRIGGKSAANERKPALRELGFKGSGRVYVLPDGRWEGSVGGSEARQRPRIFRRSLRPTHSEALTVTFKGLAFSPTVGITGGGSTTLRTRNALIDEITHVIREVAVPKVRQEMIDQSPGPRGAFEYVGRKQA